MSDRKPAFSIDEQIAAAQAAVDAKGVYDADALQAAVNTLRVMKECREPFLDIYAERKPILAVYEAFPGAKMYPHYTATCDALDQYAGGLNDNGALARLTAARRRGELPAQPLPHDTEQNEATGG